MITIHPPDEIILRLTLWADQNDSVRAILLTSTRAQPQATTDIYSDYDIVLVVMDIHELYRDPSWLSDFGEVLVVYWDPICPESDYGIEQTGNVTQYADGLKIDFRLWPVALMQRIAQASTLPPGLDAGYKVLVDKDGVTAGIHPPSFRAYIPTRPAAEAYETFVHEFFSDAPYVAKCLWRDELLPAKWCLDYDMKHVYLRRMLEWRAQRDHGWALPVGNLGKGLKKHLPPTLWRELESTYVGAGIDDNWEALFRTMTLFRLVAMEVADDLGYTYPVDLDRRVTNYVRTMRDVGHSADPGV
jgi:aminoglycoside 6-adenylyltransferase